ncbi:killer cell lectin-like receptor subfamily B member 1 [Lacerta agilis]|uniref:killer cell lectin-like receptor subfamily B member 1 n=1 Tax=Lacerta agilis TaxID=80427 RepID=UPI00141A2FAE|nr:killer cell lectin-like receptor subfamily B member 1 [Lacerta agilis]
MRQTVKTILNIVFLSTVNSPCKVCPVQWQLHRNKCYWTSEDIKTWGESKHDCSTRDSQLLIIQDKEELTSVLIFRCTLFFHRLPKPNYAEGNYCAIIKQKVNSERCSRELQWICQKESLLL